MREGQRTKLERRGTEGQRVEDGRSGTGRVELEEEDFEDVKSARSHRIPIPIAFLLPRPVLHRLLRCDDKDLVPKHPKKLSVDLRRAELVQEVEHRRIIIRWMNRKDWVPPRSEPHEHPHLPLRSSNINNPQPIQRRNLQPFLPLGFGEERFEDLGGGEEEFSTRSDLEVVGGAEDEVRVGVAVGEGGEVDRWWGKGEGWFEGKSWDGSGSDDGTCGRCWRRRKDRLLRWLERERRGGGRRGSVPSERVEIGGVGRTRRDGGRSSSNRRRRRRKRDRRCKFQLHKRRRSRIR
ncbi:hypothetical protein BDY24DRAFT_376950 [Mrakia frigida]|uniref:uncharacterized protein n=1 Tax=Mrakia frigida TaxID=29902 RepID=UPI003FCBFAFD